MAPDPRVVKAFDATRALGIPDEEMKPVLKYLLKVYDGKWELIEDDNYRTLVDAYFEFKEDKQAEGKRKAPISDHDGERPTQKLHLVDGDEQVLSSGKSGQVFSVKDNEIPPKTSKKEISKPSKISMGDMKPTTSSRALQTKLSEVERTSKLPCMDARNRKSHPKKASSTENCEDPIDGPSCPRIQRKNMLSDHYQKELKTPRIEKPKNMPSDHDHKESKTPGIEKPKLHLGPGSTGNCEDPIDGPRCPCIQRKNMPSDHYQKELKTPRIEKPMNMPSDHDQKEFKTPGVEKPKLRLGPGSTSYRGPSNEASNGNIRMKSLSTLYQEHKKDDTPVAQDKSRNSSKFLSDITKGSENVKISLLDEIGSEELPKFNYTPCNIIYQCANVNISLARIADQGCCSDCSGDCLSLSFPCACAQETGGEFAYTPQGLLKEEFLKDCISMKNEPKDHHFLYCQECPLERSKNEYKPEPCKGHMVRKFIKECWRKCGCDMQCGNRVVQRGLRCKLQVFLTREGKGWGVRALEELPKGSFVCEYAGEILTNTELYERTVQSSGNERHTYPVTLDADWGSEGVLKDEEALCLDATYNGNVARFINHRCSDANLIDIPVEVETPDRHYYHLALFTNRKVKAFEELTWDYGIDFDDHEHPIKAFQCCCGSAVCRDKKQKGTKLWQTKKLRKTSAQME